jgi:L-threonylcarbamoyladenylate synthase
VIDNQKIENLTGIKINPFQFKSKDNNIKPNSPGQMLKHYSPITPLKINVLKPKHNDAFLNFGTKIFIHHKPSLNLSKKSNLDEAAYNLFDYLRKLDKLNKSRIAVAPIPNKGIGKTINERLHRASI